MPGFLGYGTEMAENASKGNGKESGGDPEPARLDHPAQLARRELVEWCKEHKLPVPAERPPRR